MSLAVNLNKDFFSSFLNKKTTSLFFIFPGVAAAASRKRRAAGVSPFADLSMEEIRSVQEYVHKQKDLKLTNILHAQISDSYILLIEALRPNKADVINYFDNSGTPPQRAARVIIHR